MSGLETHTQTKYHNPRCTAVHACRGLKDLSSLLAVISTFVYISTPLTAKEPAGLKVSVCVKTKLDTPSRYVVCMGVH